MTSTSRRAFLSLLASAGLLINADPVRGFDEGGSLDPQLGDPSPFSPDLVADLARAYAAKPWVAPPDVALPDIDYDGYRQIRFRPDRAIWREDGLPFQLQLFHPGWLFRHPVEIDLVHQGESRRLLFAPALFANGPDMTGAEADGVPGFAGLRLHHPLNSAEFDEFLVFLGASYFRAVGAGQVYGLSARGLAIGTASPAGEEFPMFRHFWLVEPDAGASSVVVHALLDSPSMTGAYQFRAIPGEVTRMEVEATLFPRVTVETVGIAPLTSMFYFGPQDRAGIDDFRTAVHDSDQLLLRTGAEEWITRPVLNPASLQISSFLDDGPKGFGLMQRARRFEDFLDLEARYERRPSLWVEPLGNWGRGATMLVEIPTGSEANDNIVAFWRPEAPLASGSEHRFAYRLSWGDEPVGRPDLARVVATRTGLGEHGRDAAEVTRRLFVIEFEAPGLADLVRDGAVEVLATASAGELSEPVLIAERPLQVVRAVLELDPGSEAVVELSCMLTRDGAPVSEKWVFRWLSRP